jgi:hypothetical protein
MSSLDPRALYPLFPAAPMVLGRMTYDAWAATWAAEPSSPEATDTGKAPFLRDEEAFWRQGDALLGERYRKFAELGFSLELGRIAIAAEASPESEEGPAETAFRTHAPDEDPDALTFRLQPQAGSPVRVRRSNGFVEESWVLARLEARGRCLLQRGSFTKAIDLIDLMILNPELVPVGTPVRVPRSSGALDSGWAVKRIERGLLIVEKPGLGRKGLTPEQFFAANPKLASSEAEEAATSLVRPVVGSPVLVRRSTGEREAGWVVADHLAGMEVPVQRETPEGVLSKTVALEELLEDNPLLIPKDLPLRVMRSSGALDDGWLVMGVTGGHVRLERPDIGEKEASSRDLIAWNRDRLLDETSSAVAPSVASPEGLAQAARFREHGRLDERIVDGYWDGAPMGGRPALVVHRGRDMALASGLAFARELTGRPELERIHRLAEVVWQFMGEAASGSPLGTIGPRDDQGVLLGDVPRMLGAGSNLARALMFAVMASEAGLLATLRRGELVLPGVRGGHVWCEVSPQGGDALLIDLSVLPPPPGYAFPPAEHPAIRACYVVPGGPP